MRSARVSGQAYRVSFSEEELSIETNGSSFRNGPQGSESKQSQGMYIGDLETGAVDAGDLDGDGVADVAIDQGEGFPILYISGATGDLLTIENDGHPVLELDASDPFDWDVDDDRSGLSHGTTYSLHLDAGSTSRKVQLVSGVGSFSVRTVSPGAFTLERVLTLDNGSWVMVDGGNETLMFPYNDSMTWTGSPQWFAISDQVSGLVMGYHLAGTTNHTSLALTNGTLTVSHSVPQGQNGSAILIERLETYFAEDDSIPFARLTGHGQTLEKEVGRVVVSSNGRTAGAGWDENGIEVSVAEPYMNRSNEEPARMVIQVSGPSEQAGKVLRFAYPNGSFNGSGLSVLFDGVELDETMYTVMDDGNVTVVDVTVPSFSTHTITLTEQVPVALLPDGDDDDGDLIPLLLSVGLVTGLVLAGVAVDVQRQPRKNPFRLQEYKRYRE